MARFLHKSLPLQQARFQRLEPVFQFLNPVAAPMRSMPVSAFLPALMGLLGMGEGMKVGFLFIGSIGLTQYFAVIPGAEETILSALARRILGDGPAYIFIQASTMLILAVAANTSFAE